MAPVSLRARAAAIAAAAVTCVGLIGLTLSVRQGARSEMLGYSYSNMPGAFGPAYGVSPPSVKFHVTQQLPTGPHPMTTDALVTSNNAISFAQAVGNTEREDKQRLEDVSAPALLSSCLPSLFLPVRSLCCCVRLVWFQVVFVLDVSDAVYTRVFCPPVCARYV